MAINWCCAPASLRRSRWPADTLVEDVEKKFAIRIPRDLPRGGVVGIAGLAGVVTLSDDPFFEGPYGLVMVGARRLPFVPATGALGLRPAPLDLTTRVNPAIVKAVRRAIERANGQ